MNLRSLTGAVLAAMGAFALCGCEVVLGFDDRQLYEPEGGGGAAGTGGMGGGGGAGGDPDPLWGCLGQIAEPTPDPRQSVDLTLQLWFATSASDPVTSGIVDVCAIDDITCEGTDPDLPTGLSLDGEGRVTVTVAEGFDGYLRVGDPEIIDSRFYVGKPIVESGELQFSLFRPNEFETLTEAAGISLNPARGVAMIMALDCQSNPATGVRYEFSDLGPEGTPFYFNDALPDPTRTVTNEDGGGGACNLPPGAMSVSSYLDEDGAFIGAANLHIRANTISYLQLGPTPR